MRTFLTYGIDRQSLVDNNYGGLALPTTLPISPMSPYYSKSLAATYDYDEMRFIDAASKLRVPTNDKGVTRTLKLLVNSDDSARLRCARNIAATLTHEMAVIRQICTRVAILDGGRIAEEGTVDDVFVHTRSAAGRRLFGIVPSKQEEVLPEKPALRIVFDDGRENQPIIAGLVKQCGVDVNILSADMKRIGGKSYGQMLIEMPQDDETRKKIIQFLSDEGLTVKEVYPQ